MDIETGKTPIGQDYIKFKTKYNETCTLVAFEGALRCAIREEGDMSMHAPFTHFTRDEVKALLSYLQTYVETGTFELREAGTDIADQGKRIEGLEKEKAYCLRQLDKQVDQIAELEELLEEWSKTHGCACPDCYPDLHKRTIQLLAEEDPSHE